MSLLCTQLISSAFFQFARHGASWEYVKEMSAVVEQSMTAYVPSYPLPLGLDGERHEVKGGCGGEFRGKDAEPQS